MSTYIFEGDITTENFHRLQEAVINRDPGDYLITEVLLCSNGGLGLLINPFINLLNDFNIKLIATDHLLSAAWIIFLLYPGKKAVAEGFSHAGLHISAYEDVSVRELLDKNSLSSIKLSHTRHDIRTTLAQHKGFLTKREKKRIRKGKWVFFDRNKVIKICKL